MHISRSLGYVQIYFGTFLIIAGVAFSFASIAKYHDANDAYYDASDIPDESARYGLETGSYEYKMLLNSYEAERDAFITKKLTEASLNVVLTILFMLFGILFSTEGISKTRQGSPKEVHPVKKLMNNILLAGILGVITVWFFYMLVL